MAKCRGPDPGLTFTKAGLLGVSDPVFGSKRYTSNSSSPRSADEDELIIVAGLYLVRVWTGLTILVHAGAGMLHKGRARAESAVLFDGKRRDVSAAVVRHQEIPSSLV